MRFLKRNSIFPFIALIVIIIAGNAFGAVPELPDGLVMEDKYRPGLGVPVGKIKVVQGNVIIIHTDLTSGYWAKKGLSIYKGDTIITQKKSRANIRMNDKSVISLSSNTKIVINKSVYNPKKKSRSSFLGLSLGKARFLVTKLFQFKRSEFRVKTPTAVCGVRGSDFIIIADAEMTDVIALEDTKLAVVSLAAPDAPPKILNDFERTGVPLGKLPFEPVFVLPDELEELKIDFIGVQMESTPAEESEVRPTKTGEADTATTESTEGTTAQEDAQTGGAMDGAMDTDTPVKGDAAEVGATDVYLSPDVLVNPGDMRALEVGVDPDIEIPDEFEEPEVADQAAEEQKEEDLAIPPFPGAPE